MVTTDTQPVRARWGVYLYLSRDTRQFREFVEQEWAAIEALDVPASVVVAVQQDSDQFGARRWCKGGGRSADVEQLDDRNHGDVEEALEFLAWARNVVPAQHTVLVLGGTGVLDPWSTVGAEGDPTRTFAICDDAKAGDALEVSELNSLFQRYAEAAHQPLDVLVLDMSAMQWLEVAYQFQNSVTFMVGAQGPISPGPCPIAALVSAFAADPAVAEPPVEEFARRAAEALSSTYLARVAAPANGMSAPAPTVVSVIRLSALETVARAFDTFSHALMLALGEEIVWDARGRIAKHARRWPFGPKVPNGNWSSGFFDKSAYDLVGLMKHSEQRFKAARRGAVGRAVAIFLARQDERTLFENLADISERINLLNAGGTVSSKKNPADTYVDFCKQWGPLIRAGKKPRDQIEQLERALKPLRKRVRGREGFWVTWARTKGPHRPALQRLFREIEVTNEGAKLAGRLQGLARRVLKKLAVPSVQNPNEALIVAKYPAESPLCGIAIYRPLSLDTLLNANYLRLDFNRRSHWAALLAVINLVQGHARAMWRVIESVLSTAPLDAREALLQRVFGPTTVVAGFRDQLKVLASPPLATLSLSERVRTTGNGTNDTIEYVVRYTPCEPLATISEETASLSLDDLAKRVTGLQAVLRLDRLTRADLDEIDDFGKLLGNRVLRNQAKLVEKDRRNLEGKPAPGERRRKTPIDSRMHLQLQVPPELMRYPWELMHGKSSGRLADRYAIARQVYIPEGLIRSRPRVRSNRLRTLIIAAPKPRNDTAPPLAAAQREGAAVKEVFESLAGELGDVIDFRAEDVITGERATKGVVQLRLMEGDYDVVHFAGHGRFTPNNPNETGWLLSDGLLSVGDVRDALSWARKPPWLVYANACQSVADATDKVVYQGDLHDLASAFITNGVSAYIGSLWNVADLVGFRMAVEFYDALCLKRMTLGRALLSARMAVQAPLTQTLEDLPPNVDVDTLLVLTSSSFALFGDPTAKALDQIGTAPPKNTRRPMAAGRAKRKPTA